MLFKRLSERHRTGALYTVSRGNSLELPARLFYSQGKHQRAPGGVKVIPFTSAGVHARRGADREPAGAGRGR